jgi:hypothetical protein
MREITGISADEHANDLAEPDSSSFLCAKNKR